MQINKPHKELNKEWQMMHEAQPVVSERTKTVVGIMLKNNNSLTRKTRISSQTNNQQTINQLFKKS